MKLGISRLRARQRGSAVLVLIVLLGLMLIFIGANLKSLHIMSRELKLIEKRQVQRLQSVPAVPEPAKTTGGENRPGTPP